MLNSYVKVLNVDNCVQNQRVYHVDQGDHNGIIIDGENYILKYNKAIPEYLGSHIYALLGYPVQETLLVERNGKLACACKDFLSDTDTLITIKEAKCMYEEKLLAEVGCAYNDSRDQKGVISILEDLMFHLEYNPLLKSVSDILERFWDMLIVDIFIGNSDRNSLNWAIVQSEDGSNILSPVYDNGDAFCFWLYDADFSEYKTYDTFIYNTVSSYALRGRFEKILARDILRIDSPELKESLKKNISLIKDSMKDIYDMIDKLSNVLNEDYRIFCKNSLKDRFGRILVNNL